MITNKKFEVVHANKRTYHVDEDILLHYHKDAHLYLVVKGSPSFFVENKEFQLKEGQLFFVPPKLGHRMPSNGQECLLVSIRILIIDEFFKSHLKAIPEPIKCEETIANLLKYVYEHYRFKDQQNVETIDSILASILFSFFQNEISYQYKDSHITKLSVYSELTRKIILYLEKNFLRKLSLEELASSMNYNPNYLCRIFKQETGLTIVKYLTFLRIKHANDLLIYNYYDLSTASLCANFSDLSFFSRTYKKMMGFTAISLRKLIHKISDEDRKDFFLNLELLNFRQTTIIESLNQFDEFKNTVKRLLEKYRIN